MVQPCRSCGGDEMSSFCDLGSSPASNAFLSEEQLSQAEAFFPLHARVCHRCFLVQLEQFHRPEEIFSDDYAYFSSYSDTWLNHAAAFAEMMIGRFGLNDRSFVVEIASNDGYLLQYFKRRAIPVLGIEPTANTAQVAQDRGIPTATRFFGSALATELSRDRRPDLIVGNNVLAHVPDLNDFVAGVASLLKEGGIATFEFPHLSKLIQFNQFDTIYHEHFCYFSLHAVEQVFARHGLSLFDVDEIATHGGSLRIYVQHAQSSERRPIEPRLAELRERERREGILEVSTYTNFLERVFEAKRSLLGFLIDAKRAAKSVVAYGAAAKGNTLLNYCGIRTDFVDYVCDRNVHKQGRFLPGVHIPVVSPDAIEATRPDYVLILPWNIKDEIIENLAGIKTWGGQFVVAIPKLEFVS